MKGALKLQAINISNGILPLPVTTVPLLIQKYLVPRNPPPEVLLEGPIKRNNTIVYDDIDKSLVLKADGCRILTST